MTAKTTKKKTTIAKNATATVSRNFKFKAESDDETPEVLRDSSDEETILIQNFVTATAEVGCEISMTLNLGDFESAKITVSLKTPCYVEEEDMAFDYTQKWVEDRIKKEHQLIKRYLKGDVNPL